MSSRLDGKPDEVEAGRTGPGSHAVPAADGAAAARPLTATVEASAPERPQASSRPLATDELPFTDWDRYELLGLLGKGGMGAVYKARDRHLGRIVALKFILGGHPRLTMRFLQEARAQARIDHPNVCRVFEVGEIEGRAYIAMQFVDGLELGRAAAMMSHDEQAAVVRDAAFAIHEAHKLGIVHRDLKPANILVARGDDGRWCPVVMDFGLAREATAEKGLTESGALLGTPAYMSPEQARGDVRAVDRRADVYSLGATFYELLTGRPPFAQGPLATALDQILNQEPAAPRSLAPHVPVDLETIALKSLAKDPERRYASARALGDDLARYLDGEPILGRRPSLWHRMRLRARRQRALFAVTATSAVLILVLAGLGLRARARAGEHARLAETLAQESKEVEWLLRAAMQLPLHDTTPERALIRERMHAIATMSHGLGRLGDGVVQGALGRAHLALHEWAAADDALARAAAAGLDTPGLHAARGRALGERYHRATDALRRSGDRGWQAQEQQRLERRYLEPALAELARSRGSDGAGESPLVLEALIALYRRDYPLAEARAGEAVKRTPWLLEAHKLAADAAYGAGLELADRGHYEEAGRSLERATQFYADAASVARSDAAVHEAAAQAWLERAELEYRQGRPPRPALEQALAAIDQALVAEPELASAYATKAYVLDRWYRTPALRKGAERPLLERIAASARRATELEPRDAGAWDALGNAHRLRGVYEMGHGGDPRPWWQQALAELSEALAIEPHHPWANNDLGLVHRWLGAQRSDAGDDPMPEYRAALRSFEAAAAIDPQYLFARSNQTEIQADIAEYQVLRGIDPSDTVASARAAGERCFAIDASFYSVLDHLARAELSLAEYALDAHRDPGPSLAAARHDLDRAIAIHPAHMPAYYFRQVADNDELRHRLRLGVAAGTLAGDARSAFAQALSRNSDCAYCFVEAARTDLLEAAGAARAGRPATAALSEARSNARHAIALDPKLALAKTVGAEVELRLSQLQPGAAARRALASGLALTDEALSLSPGLARTHALRAALLARQCALEPSAGSCGASAQQARDEAARATAINPLMRGESDY